MSPERTAEKSDLELVLESRQGREEAFRELVRRHKEKAVRLAYAAVGNYEDAKDVSQEAFVKAYRSLARFEMKSQFSTWLTRILMNTAKDFRRRKRWMNFLAWENRETMENFFDALPAGGSAPAENILNKELGAQMTYAIRKLPVKQQWIFTLRFLEGFSIQEIADATQLAEGTVKASLHFAVKKFGQMVYPYLEKGDAGYGF